MTTKLLPFDRQAAADLLRSPHTLATVLHLIALAAYGDALYGDPEQGVDGWDPIELFNRLDEDFHAKLPEENENRLNALMLAISTDGFYEDPDIFRSVANSLYSGDLGGLPDGFDEDLTIAEMLWAVYEVGLNRDDDTAFTPQVDAVIDRIMAAESEELPEDTDDDNLVEGHQEFIASMKRELETQLLKLGLSHEDVRKISSPA